MPAFPARLKAAHPRKGFVEQREYDKLAANAGALWMRALLATARAFGFRSVELLDMRMKQIDLTIGRSPCGETNGGEPRLTDAVLVLLTE